MNRPLRQEQEDPSDEITEVAPGILRVQLPVHLPGLGHVNCYALEDERGFAVVDPGLPGDEHWSGLVDAFRRAEIALSNVHTIICTHSHPDHFGGAARLRLEGGVDAEVIAHRYFRTPFEPGDEGDSDPNQLGDDDKSGAPIGGPFGQPVPWGGATYQPLNDVDRARMAKNASDPLFAPHPTRRVDDADCIRLGRRDWVALFTPGHTNDHLCLYDPETGVVLSGDHVLPTITPHISGIHHGRDPLASYFVSLRRMQDLDNVTVVLPAHGHPFASMNQRVDDIIEHHVERLEVLVNSAHELGRAGSVDEFMQKLFRERSWGSMAASETYAHLEHLRIRGDATTERDDSGLLFYDLSSVVAP